MPSDKGYLSGMDTCISQIQITDSSLVYYLEVEIRRIIKENAHTCLPVLTTCIACLMYMSKYSQARPSTSISYLDGSHRSRLYLFFRPKLHLILSATA